MIGAHELLRIPLRIMRRACFLPKRHPYFSQTVGKVLPQDAVVNPLAPIFSGRYFGAGSGGRDPKKQIAGRVVRVAKRVARLLIRRKGLEVGRPGHTRGRESGRPGTKRCVHGVEAGFFFLIHFDEFGIGQHFLLRRHFSSAFVFQP